MSKFDTPPTLFPEDGEQAAPAPVDVFGSLALEGAESREAQEFEPIKVEVDHEKLADTELPPEMDWVRSLPETLSLDEPITLIVGENASGKTQFSRALLKRLSVDREGGDTRSRAVLLGDEEPAQALAEAIRLGEPRKGNLIANFMEGQEVMYKSREWQEGMEDSAEHRKMSSREVFEHTVETLKDLRIDGIRDIISSKDKEVTTRTGTKIEKGTGGEVVTVYDEPEVGLSPQRQMGLEGILEDFADSPDHSLIVPTNNLALFLSDMPRIDTSKPERGVHRPSDYGESGGVEFHSS